MPEKFPPLTSDIIGNNNVGDPCCDTICKGRCHSIVNINVPEFKY